MSEFNEVELMAYADGTLPPERAARIEAAARDNPVLQARIERFQASTRLLQGAFVQADREAATRPLPPALQALLQLPPVAPGPRVVPLRPRRSRPPALRWGLALAASLALGLATALLVTRTGGEATSPALAVALAEALPGQLPSGEPRAISVDGQGWEALVLGSTQQADGRYCRELELLPADPAATAERHWLCQDGAGWAPVTVAEGSAGSGDWQLASGGAPLSPGRRLSTAEEAAALARGWTAPR